MDPTEAKILRFEVIVAEHEQLIERERKLLAELKASKGKRGAI